MGLFTRLGRTVEQFKQTASNTADESARFQCRACTARFQTRHDRCPDCGATEVTPTTTEE